MNDDDDNIVSIEINRRTALLSRTMEIEMCSIHTPHTPHTRSTFQSDSEWFGTFGVEIMKTHVAKLSPSIVEYRWRKKTISSMTMANIVSHFKHSFFLYFFICFHPIFDIFSINFFFLRNFLRSTRASSHLKCIYFLTIWSDLKPIFSESGPKPTYRVCTSHTTAHKHNDSDELSEH